ncbi:MAG: type I glyceraldehyde-3-phosphate dehydrogenase [Rickettsiales bacterium]|jgi:glyceraldehyde 3-phosphate dehydrogenase|nr:type I glyceraldehyde-3-phosphate dehydrogenase [Rickettsiales bacterium]
MSKTKVAINGFGRIGRLVLRAALESKRDDLEFVAVNDLMPADQSAFLLEYDSVHGKLETPVRADGDAIRVGAREIKVIAERTPSNLPWKELGVDIVMECTGLFASAEKARVHLDAGAKRVLVSAPSDGADATIVYGINDKTLKKTDLIVSNGSCTTNCLAPIARVVDEKFGIAEGWMTTVHSYTGDQQLLDRNHPDFRRARAAAINIIPSSTGAAKAIGVVLPNLDGRLNGTAIRVPTPDVSITELIVRLENKASADEVNAAMRRAAENELKGILGYSEIPLVSSDFIHDSRSSIFDATMTKIVGERTLHIASWYDNEWGFSNRMCDTAAEIGKLIG